MLCYQVCRALDDPERVAAATDASAGIEHWLTAVALNDALPLPFMLALLRQAKGDADGVVSRPAGCGAHGPSVVGL